MKKRGTIGAVEQPQYTLAAYPEFLHLLGSMLKWDRITAQRFFIMQEIGKSARYLDRVLPSANLLQFSAPEHLQIENLNVFFWRALLQRGVFNKRSSEVGLANKGSLQGNEFMSKAERELKQLVIDLGLHIYSEDTLLKNPLKIATPVEVGKKCVSQFKIVRLQDITSEEEGNIPKLEINDISFWVETGAHDASESELVGSNSLSRLLGAVQQKRKKDKMVTKNAGEEALIEEVRVLGKNHCKNVSYYLLDEVSKLMKKLPKPSPDKAVEASQISGYSQLVKIVEKVSKIKFRLTASKSMPSFILEIQFEDEDDDRPVQVDRRARQIRLVIDELSKFPLYKHYEACIQRSKLIELYDVVEQLSSGSQKIRAPYYMLNLLTSSELALKDLTKKPSVAYLLDPQMEYRKQAAFKMVTDLKLIQYEEFDKILAEFDRYVKEKKKGAPTQLQTFLKSEGLTSLIETKPLDSSVFRHMDVRVRVFTYDLRRQFCENLSKADTFIQFLNTTCKQGFEQYSRKLQFSLRIASSDLALKSYLIKDSDSLTPDDVNCLQEFSLSVRRNFKSERWSKRWEFDEISLSSRNIELSIALMQHTTQSNVLLRELVNMSVSGDCSVNARHLTPVCKELVRARMDQLMKKFEAVPEVVLLWAVKLMDMVQVSCWDMRPTKPKLANSLGVTGLLPSTDRATAPQVSPQETLRLYMAKMLAAGLLRDKKLAETSLIIEQFRVTMKKDGEAVKNMELDHLHNMWMNFCKVAVNISRAGVIQKPSTNKLWVKTPVRPSWNTGWKSHTPVTGQGENSGKIIIEAGINLQVIQEYFSDSIDSSFVLTDPDTLVSSGVFVLGEFWKALVNEQRGLYGVMATAIAQLKNTAKIDQSTARKVKMIPEEKETQIVPLSQSLLGTTSKLCLTAEKSLFPFAKKLLSSLVQGSFSIRTNKDEDFYLMSRSKFVDTFSQALSEVDLFVQKRCLQVRDYYLTTCVNAVIQKAHMGAALYRERGAFTKLIREVHRIVESRLAELNISIVYQIDALCRSVRESNYMGGVLLEKIQDAINSRYDETQTAQLVSKEEWEERDVAMPKHIHQEIRDIIYKAHNQNMGLLKEKMRKILEDDVKILDQAGRPLEKTATDIQDERLAKLNQYYYRLKESYRKTLADEEVRLRREHFQIDQDKVSIDQLRKRIRELTVREGLLRTEEATAKIEMEALKQQNVVLERDIHTCNFERVNLTRQLQNQKDKLDKLRQELMRQRDQNSRNQTKLAEELSSGESDTEFRDPNSRTSELKNSYGRLDHISNSLLPQIKPAPGVASTKPKYTAAEYRVDQPVVGKKKSKKQRTYKFENGKLQTTYKFE